MAAGIAAVAFTMGWLVHPVRPSSPAQDRTPPIATHQDTQTSSDESPEVVQATEPEGEFVRQPGDGRFYPDSSPPVVAVARVRVGSGRNGAAGPNINEPWHKEQPPRLTEYQQALLERHGYQVNQHRRIITATMADGRRVALPVEQVQVRYTGNNPL